MKSEMNLGDMYCHRMSRQLWHKASIAHWHLLEGFRFSSLSFPNWICLLRFIHLWWLLVPLVICDMTHSFGTCIISLLLADSYVIFHSRPFIACDMNVAVALYWVSSVILWNGVQKCKDRWCAQRVSLSSRGFFKSPIRTTCPWKCYHPSCGWLNFLSRVLILQQNLSFVKWDFLLLFPEMQTNTLLL